MKIKAVFFDFGGVIMRTEYQAPRQTLAERFNMDYDELDKFVFNSDSARRASIGEISEPEHWAEVLRRLKRPASEVDAFSDQFFGGDVIDREIVEYLRTIRGKVHTGLISNAWSGLRGFITREKIIDSFESVTISAEVGIVKPDAKIYQIALEKAQVEAKDAVFVDDLPKNIEACESLGMQGILFKDPNEAMQRLKDLI